MSEHDDNIDEVALNTLLLQGVDFPTALAASVRDEPKPPSEPPKRSIFTLGWWMLGGLFILVLILRTLGA